MNEAWLHKYLDTMGAAYLIKLIKDNTVSVEDKLAIHRVLRRKINKEDVRLEGNVLIIGDNRITIPQILLQEIHPKEIDIMFESIS